MLLLIIILILLFGGDGTMLQAARDLDGSNTPLLGINIGGLGFLTAVPSKELPGALERLWKGEFKYESRALIQVSGDIEGRIILDLDPETAGRVASKFAGTELPETDELVRETVFELANQVIGNAVTVLNDQGFHFRVHPPTLHTSDHGPKSSEDTEALVICFETGIGDVFMNIALRHSQSHRSGQATAVGQ